MSASRPHALSALQTHLSILDAWKISIFKVDVAETPFHQRFEPVDSCIWGVDNESDNDYDYHEILVITSWFQLDFQLSVWNLSQSSFPYLSVWDQDLFIVICLHLHLSVIVFIVVLILLFITSCVSFSIIEFAILHMIRQWLGLSLGCEILMSGWVSDDVVNHWGSGLGVWDSGVGICGWRFSSRSLPQVGIILARRCRRRQCTRCQDSVFILRYCVSTLATHYGSLDWDWTFWEHSWW